MHNPFLRRVTHQSMFLVCLCGGAAAADVPPASMPAPVPRIERIVPLEQDPAVQGSFFREDFENLPALKGRFFDVAEGPGKFCISEADAFDGKKGLDQSYINRHAYDARDKGSAGWISRFFGDSPLFASRIENESPEAFIAIERHTTAPGTHREWIPKSVTRFSCSNPGNIGRWIHMEMAVTLGDKPRSDHVQAWAGLGRPGPAGMRVSPPLGSAGPSPGNAPSRAATWRVRASCPQRAAQPTGGKPADGAVRAPVLRIFSGRR